MNLKQRSAVLVLFGAMVALLIAIGPAGVSADNRRDEPIPVDQARFWQLINEYRQSKGLKHVGYDPDLSMKAAENNRRGGHHTYVPAGCSQNWCWASDGMTADRAFVMWKNSPGHNRNMLSAGHRRCGIAINGNHATLNLAR